MYTHITHTHTYTHKTYTHMYTHTHTHAIDILIGYAERTGLGTLDI